ncbi:hypothetical protein [Salirhabdus sp. Marseille-P4669]|uniref:hypothetical protein n=1 Tax=Salirhabdus sp. Marseille-P4669 TaxID=2042310 RepID=UPI000C7D8EA7|nr:hypothetical protein [Salirhabdus sp. Marseille-P4669]
MYSVKVLDKAKKIAMLKWEGVVKVEEVNDASKQLDDVYRTFGSQKFYLMVDVKDLKVFSPDTKEAIVEQQKWIKDKLHVSAVVMDKKLIEVQLKEVGQKSSVNSLEVPFPTYEEALAYLEKLAA